MQSSLVAALCILGTLSVASAACDVSMADFNAFGNGVDYDDDALASALNKCRDGGRIVFPAGQYLLSPFNITSNMELYLEKGSVLLATTDWSRWPVVAPFPSYPDVSPIVTTPYTRCPT